jgi:hypothetical protein
MPQNGMQFFPQPHSGIPAVFLLFFVVVFVFVVGSIIVKAVSRGAEWADNNSSPEERTGATLVSKRVEVSGGQNATSTKYYATFELPGGIRQEFKLRGSEYGQLAEGDRGTITRQGTRYLGFARGPAAEPEPPPPVAPSFPANRVCAYCGSAIPDASPKCVGCGWTWHPDHKSPVET